jgi:hypothetical protein
MDRTAYGHERTAPASADINHFNLKLPERKWVVEKIVNRYMFRGAVDTMSTGWRVYTLEVLALLSYFQLLKNSSHRYVQWLQMTG